MVVGRDKSERKAQTANQLVPTSPVARKRSVDQPITTKSTEGVTDWANRMGTIGFFTKPEYRSMMGKHRELAILSDQVTN